MSAFQNGLSRFEKVFRSCQSDRGRLFLGNETPGIVQTHLGRHDWVVRGLVIVGTGLWCGCNFGPPSVVVSGTVSYQGEMVRQGEIIFADVQSTAPAAVGKVEDGRYRLETLAGEKRVRITASKETGRIVEGAMGTTYPEQVDLLPPEYNSASTLVRTVEPKKECVLDFQLK